MDVSVILGPPGTGKTTTLLGTMRNEMELHGVHPREIAFLTFTKEARRIAVREAGREFGLTPKDLPYFGTLHAMCYRMLGLTREFLIRDASDLHDFARKYHIEFSPTKSGVVDFDGDLVPVSGSESGDIMLQLDHWLRHRKLELTRRMAYTLFTDVEFFEALRFQQAYARYKRAEGLRDFTDLLQDAADELPVKVAFVDEAQDLSDLQWDCLFRLVRSADRVYIAGDDDQAIFTWAGASPQRFMQLAAQARAVGRRRVKRHSHRLPKAVHRFAETISSMISLREEKAFNPRDLEGELRAVEDWDDLTPRHGERWRLLVRNHHLMGPALNRLRDLGIPYTVSGVESVPPQTAKAVESWEKLRAGRGLYWTDVCTLYDSLKPGMGVEDRKWRRAVRDLNPDKLYVSRDLEDYGMIGAQLPWESVITGCSISELAYLSKVRRNCGSLDAAPTVAVSTIHAAKGSEAEHVALAGAASRRVLESADLDRDSELRVLYVGATRSLSTLTLVGQSEVLGHKWRI